MEKFRGHRETGRNEKRGSLDAHEETEGMALKKSAFYASLI